MAFKRQDPFDQGNFGQHHKGMHCYDMLGLSSFLYVLQTTASKCVLGVIYLSSNNVQGWQLGCIQHSPANDDQEKSKSQAERMEDKEQTEIRNKPMWSAEPT